MVCLLKNYQEYHQGKGILTILSLKKGYKKTATAIVVVQRPFLSPSAD